MARRRKIEEESLPSAKGAATGKLYRALKQNILRLELAPSTPIEEPPMVRRFGVSRTPLREALLQLAAEGLVELRPNRSPIVAPITAQSVDSYFEALKYVSSAVMRLAALRRTGSQLAQIRKSQERFASLLLEEHEFDRGDRNRDFHLAIGAAAGNNYLADQYRVLLDRGVRLANIPFYSEGEEGQDLDSHFRQACDDHEVMISAITDRDCDRAEAITRDHVSLFRHRIGQFLSRYGNSLIGHHNEPDVLPKLRHTPRLSIARGDRFP